GCGLAAGDPERLAGSLSARAPPPGPVRIGLAPFAGETAVLAYDAAARPTRLALPDLEPAPLGLAALERAATRLVPGQKIANAEPLTTEDAYYRSHHAARPPPVYRVRIAVRGGTPSFLHPSRGMLV